MKSTMTWARSGIAAAALGIVVSGATAVGVGLLLLPTSAYAQGQALTAQQQQDIQSRVQAALAGVNLTDAHAIRQALAGVIQYVLSTYPNSSEAGLALVAVAAVNAGAPGDTVADALMDAATTPQLVDIIGHALGLAATQLAGTDAARLFATEIRDQGPAGMAQAFAMDAPANLAAIAEDPPVVAGEYNNGGAGNPNHEFDGSLNDTDHPPPCDNPSCT